MSNTHYKVRQLISDINEAWVTNPSEEAQRLVFVELNLIGDLLSVMNKARGEVCDRNSNHPVDTVISKLSAMCLRIRRQAEMPPIEDGLLKNVISVVGEIITTDLGEAITWLDLIRKPKR